MTGWLIFELLALVSFLVAFIVRNYLSVTTTAVSCPPSVVNRGATLTRANLLPSAQNKNPSNEPVLKLKEKTKNNLTFVLANLNSNR